MKESASHLLWVLTLENNEFFCYSGNGTQKKKKKSFFILYVNLLVQPMIIYTKGALHYLHRINCMWNISVHEKVCWRTTIIHTVFLYPEIKSKPKIFCPNKHRYLNLLRTHISIRIQAPILFDTYQMLFYIF